MHFDFKHHEYILVLFYSLIFACTQFDTVTFLTSSCCSWSLKAATSRRASRCRGEIHPINSCSCKRTRDPTILSQQERILVERQLVQTCRSHAKQMRGLKWWVLLGTSKKVLILELKDATFECQQITSTPFNHRVSGTWSGMRRGITTQAGYELQSLYSLFNSLTFKNRAPKKRNNTILNKVKNNYKMIQGCRWKLVTFVVNACFCWKIEVTPKM